MKRLMLCTLLLTILALPFFIASAPAAAPPEDHAMQIQLLIQEKQIASEGVVPGRAFAYRNEAWMRLGQKVNYRMIFDAPARPGAIGTAMGQAQQAQPIPNEPTIQAVNLETAEIIALPYGTPVALLSVEVKLTPQGLNPPEPNRFAGGSRPAAIG